MYLVRQFHSLFGSFRQSYRQLPDEESSNLQPHIYQISQAAYNNILKEVTKPQTILVGGESGSGKTESVKLLVDHLSYLSTHSNRDLAKLVRAQRIIFFEFIPCKIQILNANLVLEYFGNARTIRNNNSSRYGKMI